MFTFDDWIDTLDKNRMKIKTETSFASENRHRQSVVWRKSSVGSAAKVCLANYINNRVIALASASVWCVGESRVEKWLELPIVNCDLD